MGDCGLNCDFNAGVIDLWERQTHQERAIAKKKTKTTNKWWTQFASLIFALFVGNIREIKTIFSAVGMAGNSNALNAFKLFYKLYLKNNLNNQNRPKTRKWITNYFFLSEKLKCSRSLFCRYIHTFSQHRLWNKKLTEASSTATRHSNRLGGTWTYPATSTNDAPSWKKTDSAGTLNDASGGNQFHLTPYLFTFNKNRKMTTFQIYTHKAWHIRCYTQNAPKPDVITNKKKEFYFVPTAIILKKSKADFRVMDGCLLLVNMVHNSPL